jgi:ribose/xylose/arabinose/galactoside ABC-type transport system permease subunit
MSQTLPAGRTARQTLARFTHPGANGGLAVLLLALVALFSLLIGRRFLSMGTLQDLGFQLPELGILSLARMVSLLSGGLNLAVISTANLCALTMAWLLTTLPVGATGIGWGGAILLSILAGFAVAAVIGAIIGYVIAYLGVSPILATLGMMSVVKGIAIGLTRGKVISGFPAPIVFLGNGLVLDIPVPFLIFVLSAIPVAVMLARSPFGLTLYMIGSNERAVRFSAIDTRRVILKLYILSSLLACVAAVVMMARFNSANASYGESYLLVTILACVLGGVDPYGGFGRVGGLVLALLILQVISSAFNLLGLSQFLTLAIWGAVLLGTSFVARLLPAMRR